MIKDIASDAALDGAITPEPNTGHLRECVIDLDLVVAGAMADRDLAMYQAYRAGMACEEIAGWVCADADKVRAMVRSLDREEDIDEWGAPGRWVRLY